MKAWRTLVVFGVPAIITVIFWWTVGTNWDATLQAKTFKFFGNDVSLEAAGPTAVYFILLFIAAQIYSPVIDELMPTRKRLRGNYLFNVIGSPSPLDGDFDIEIDKEKGRLTIHGSTKDGRALTVRGRIVLSPQYLAFVADVDGGKAGRYFIECDLTANAKSPIPPDNIWSRLDGNGNGTITITKSK